MHTYDMSAIGSIIIIEWSVLSFNTQFVDMASTQSNKQLAWA